MSKAQSGSPGAAFSEDVERVNSLITVHVLTYGNRLCPQPQFVEHAPDAKLLQLFQQEPSHVPAVPASGGPQQATTSPPGGYSQSAPDSPTAESLNTLDEPVWHTIKRDLIRIYGNLVLVVFPFKNRDQQSAALRNWDLWGPMVCVRPSFVF